MRFVYEEHSNYTLFSANPENEMESSGFRPQGPYIPIQLNDNRLIVKYISQKKLHPDIIAAICITAFYPFIHKRATMPFPVSKRFASGLQMDILPQHSKIDGVYKATEPIEITNIDENVEPYSMGENTVIAYGGGIDSTSIACLFPEYDLIHSTDLNNNHNNNIIELFVYKHLDNNIHTIESNCKKISLPNGFTTFTNIYITPLIMSADLNIKNIMCGSILGSSCLSNGSKYFPQFDEKRRNRWERFYNHIGINMFSPIAGCSELITSKIVCEHGLYDKVIYCDLNEGLPCNKCTKCLRKQLELTYHGKIFTFEQYDKQCITNFLKTQSLYFAHIFIEITKKLSEQDMNPNLKWIIQQFNNVIPKNKNTSFLNNIYSKSFSYFPEKIKQKIIEQLIKYSKCMTIEDEFNLENWDISVNNTAEVTTTYSQEMIQGILHENTQLKLENKRLQTNIDIFMKIIDQINIARLEIT